MKHKPARHLLTCGNADQITAAVTGPNLKGHTHTRIALVGRSNVGKSTLINSLTRSTLAQTSKQPGKTRLLHFYLWEEAKRILVDLPGYGFAKASKFDRNSWEQLIKAYFDTDTIGLREVILILDSRHGPTELDREAIEFLSLQSIPVTFVFAKVDALKTQSERALRKKEATLALKSLGIGEPSIFWISSLKNLGLQELRSHLCS